MNTNARIENITKLDDRAVISAISDENPLVSVRAICEVTARNVISKEAKKALQDSRHNDRTFWNQYKVSTFAKAALDILGMGKYQGNSVEVKELIDSKLHIL